MKFLTFLLFLIPFQANAFLYEKTNNNLHLATSMALTYTITSGLLLTNPKMNSRQAALISAASVLLIVLAKESFYDDQFSWKDTEANTIGITLGAVPFLIWEF